MSGVVVDASVALAWCFPDEASEYADGVLVALKGQAIVVPAVWGLEIANAMLASERRKRLRQPEILRFVCRKTIMARQRQNIADALADRLTILKN